MRHTDDHAFIRRFSGILVGLIVVTVVIIVLAISMRSTPGPDANPSQLILAAERIAPVAGVHVGEEGLAEVAAAQSAAAEATASPSVEAVDGKVVYNGLCSTCHDAGVAGAPIPGSKLMAERAAKGLDAMVEIAINGINVMPPKGGNPNLTDEQIKAAVEFMLQ